MRTFILTSQILYVDLILSEKSLQRTKILSPNPGTPRQGPAQGLYIKFTARAKAPNSDSTHDLCSSGFTHSHTERTVAPTSPVSRYSDELYEGASLCGWQAGTSPNYQIPMKT